MNIKVLIGVALIALAATAAACGDDDEDAAPASTAASTEAAPASSAAPATEAASSAAEPAAATETQASATGDAAASETAASGEVVKLGFITKFPVDFFFVLEDAAKAWDEAHPEAEVIFGQGESATDDEGVIALIESMVAQGVKGIAITPTSEAVCRRSTRRSSRAFRSSSWTTTSPRGTASRQWWPRTTRPAACSPASGWRAC